VPALGLPGTLTLRPNGTGNSSVQCPDTSEMARQKINGLVS